MTRMQLPVVSLLLLVISLGANAESDRESPNILLVLLDDAGFMDFGAYGSDTATPTIDALAREQQEASQEQLAFSM